MPTAAYATSILVGGAVIADPRNRKFSVWDVIAVLMFNSVVDSISTAVPANPPKDRYEGHHTIPVYLCGSMDQKRSGIRSDLHDLLHAELASIKLTLDIAEKHATKTVGYHRSQSILKIAQTMPGRQAIARAIYMVYASGDWLDKGNSPIGEVFEEEQPFFVSGAKTSLPWCTRNGAP